MSPEARVAGGASFDKVSVPSSSVDVNISGDLAKREPSCPEYLRG